MVIFDLIGVSPDDGKFHIKMHIDSSVSEYSPLTISGVKVMELDKKESIVESSAPGSFVDIVLEKVLLKDNFIIFEPIIKNLEKIDWSKLPCGYDIIDKAVFADAASIVYNFNLISRDLTKDCHIPDEYINYYLEFKALEYSVRAKNYTKAALWYKELLRISVTTDSSCGCYGNNNI